MPIPTDVAELIALPGWADLKKTYRALRLDTQPAEAVESYACRRHAMRTKLPRLEEFWRYHVAPATLRPVNVRFRSNVDPIVSRMSAHSYEIFCNISDALDELETIEAGKLGPPRYRPCLNVLRSTGDAFQLFDQLIATIGRRREKDESEGHNLERAFDCRIALFDDWFSSWWPQRERLQRYRHMLVHHGRPWLFFEDEGDDSADPELRKGPPFVLRAEFCRRRNGTYYTWAQQNEIFASDAERRKFIPLSEACREVCDATISWLDRAYGRIDKRLDMALQASPTRFETYKTLWGWRA